jgi:hypothetical protein
VVIDWAERHSLRTAAVGGILPDVLSLSSRCTGRTSAPLRIPSRSSSGS